MKINTKSAVPAKISRAYTKMTLKTQNLAFQLFNFKWHFPTDTFFNNGSSSWLLKNMPRTHETTTESVLTNLWATYSFYCSFWVRTIDYSLDVSILRQELCTARHQFYSIFHSSDFAIQRYSDAFRPALWNMSALSVRNLHSEFGP